MKKIETLFVRNTGTHRIEPVLTPGCEWVLKGEGTATRKLDGTPVLVRDGHVYKRREVKPGRTAPPGFESAGVDETTGKEVGWVPVRPDDPGDRYFVEGIRNTEVRVPAPGGDTYELVGPKIQHNPENRERQELIAHDSPELVLDKPPRVAGLTAARAFETLDAYLADYPHEGIVWHHPDGRRAKIKRRDFGHKWPVP